MSPLLGWLLPLLSLSSHSLATFRLLPAASRPSLQLQLRTAAAFETHMDHSSGSGSSEAEELHWEQVETRMQERELWQGLLGEVFRGKEVSASPLRELLVDVEEGEEGEGLVEISGEVVREAMGWEGLVSSKEGQGVSSAQSVGQGEDGELLPVVAFDIHGDDMVMVSLIGSNDSVRSSTHELFRAQIDTSAIPPLEETVTDSAASSYTLNHVGESGASPSSLQLLMPPHCQLLSLKRLKPPSPLTSSPRPTPSCVALL